MSTLLIIICLNSGFLYSQTGYLAGTGQAGIEPDESLISLHLGGYGAPREGRFTLQWTKRGEVSDADAFCGLNDKLYTLSNGELFYYKPSDDKYSWKKCGKAANIISIAGSGGKIYALNSKKEILTSSSKNSSKWSKIGSAENSADELSVLGNTLFVADRDGNLWTANLSQKSLVWKKGKTLPGIISFASGDGILYALTADGEIYKCHPSREDHEWVKIAYKNGETIKEDIRHIAILNQRLFGISSDNTLYLGEHRTEGNLTARALAIKGGDQTMVIINVDLCGLTGDFTGLIKKELLEKHKLPYSAVFINMSHTHFAPVSQNWFTWQEANQRPDSVFLYSIVQERNTERR